MRRVKGGLTDSQKENHKHKIPNWWQTGWTGGHAPRSSGFTSDFGSVAPWPGLPFAGTRRIMGRGTGILKIPIRTDLKLTRLFIELDVDLEFHSSK